MSTGSWTRSALSAFWTLNTYNNNLDRKKANLIERIMNLQSRITADLTIFFGQPQTRFIYYVTDQRKDIIKDIRIDRGKNTDLLRCEAISNPADINIINAKQKIINNNRSVGQRYLLLILYISTHFPSTQVGLTQSVLKMRTKKASNLNSFSTVSPLLFGYYPTHRHRAKLKYGEVVSFVKKPDGNRAIVYSHSYHGYIWSLTIRQPMAKTRNVRDCLRFETSGGKALVGELMTESYQVTLLLPSRADRTII